jgi:hypothetical protein
MDNRYEKMKLEESGLRCCHKTAAGTICGGNLGKVDLQNRFFVWEDGYDPSYRKREKCSLDALDPVIQSAEDLEEQLELMCKAWEHQAEDRGLLPRIWAVYRVPAVFDMDGKSSWTEEQLAGVTATLPTDWSPSDQAASELELRLREKRILEDGSNWEPGHGLPWTCTMRPYKAHVQAGARKCAGFIMSGSDQWTFGWVQESSLLENSEQGFKQRFKKPDAARVDRRKTMVDSITV